MNEIVPSPNNNKIVTVKGKPGKYLRKKKIIVVYIVTTSVTMSI